MDRKEILEQERKELWDTYQQAKVSGAAGPVIHKTTAAEVKDLDVSGRTLTAVLSREEEDRDGDIVRVDGGKYRAYMKNPVVLWGHNIFDLPVARCQKLWTEGNDLLARDEFHSLDFARDVFHLYQSGFLSAFSIGFIPEDMERRGKEDDWSAGFDFKSWEKLEHSCVTVPSNRSALVQRAADGDPAAQWIVRAYYGRMESKGSIPFKHHELADMDESWDGPKEVAAADVADLKIMCAWYDSDEPDLKGSYKMPHHRQADKYTVWRGCAAAMAVMMGGRGGVDIPDSDREGCYNHLKKHYQEFDKEPPEMMAVEAFDWKHFRAGEQQIYEEARLAEDLHRVRGIALGVESIARGLLKRDPSVAGRHRERLDDTFKAIQATLDAFRGPDGPPPEDRATPGLMQKALTEVERVAADYRKSAEETTALLREINATRARLVRHFIGGKHG